MPWLSRLALLFFAVLPSAVNAQAANEPLRVCQNSTPAYGYRIALANLILDRTAATYGAMNILPVSDPDPSQERCLASLKSGRVDLAFVPPNAARLRDFDMLPIDLHNGMLSYRLLIIRAEDQAAFAKVNSLEALRQFTGGFGSQWADFNMFALNQLPVLGMANPNTLLEMLHQHRFDYFHRGLSEAWPELAAHKSEFPELIVEPHLALEYFLPVYFTFNKVDPGLRERFAEGFAEIQKDGSFKQLFNQYYGQAAIDSRLSGRTIIHVQTTVPSGLPALDTSLWMNDGADL